MQPSNLLIFRKALGRAMFGPTASLTVLGVLLSAGVLLNSWLLVEAAAVCWLARTAVSLGRRSLWTAVRTELACQSPSLPVEANLTDETAKRELARLVDSRLEREWVLGPAARTLLADMPSLRRQIVELETAAITLISNLERVGRCLAGRERLELQVEIGRLSELYAGARDDELRDELAQAVAIGRMRLGRYERLEGTQRLLSAQLATITETLELIPPAICDFEARAGTDLALVYRPVVESVTDELNAATAPA